MNIHSWYSGAIRAETNSNFHSPDILSQYPTDCDITIFDCIYENQSIDKYQETLLLNIENYVVH